MGVTLEVAPGGTGVREHLIKLYELQKVDSEIHEIEQRKKRLPETLKSLQSKVSELEKKIQDLVIQRDEAETQAQALEDTVQSETLKIRKWEQRLADIRNQREFLALSRETEGVRRQNKHHEENIVEFMKTAEDLDAQILSLQEEAQTQEGGAGDELKRVQAEDKDLGEKVTALNSQREGMLDGIPAQVLRKYDQIRARRAGVGISVVSNGCCTSCNMSLPPQLYNVLQRGNSVEQCPACYRLIVWETILPSDESGETSEADEQRESA